MYLRRESYSGYGVCRVRTKAVQGHTGGRSEHYRTSKFPGANPLKDAHAALDKAVLAAYSFHPAKDLLAQLLALNQSVAANIKSGALVTAPGLPDDSGAGFVTSDCIQPSKE